MWLPNLLPRTEEANSRYKNPDNDPRGPWTSGDVSARNPYNCGIYPIICPSGRIIPGPPKGMYWRVSKDNFEKLDADKRIWWGKDGNNTPRLKRFLSEVQDGKVPQTLWPYKEVGHTQEAKKELIELINFSNSDDVFVTPKPTRLIQRILQIATDKDSIILDSFAGSGTTGHAVLKQNTEDGGSRRFILVEMDQNIAENVTAERLRRVADGYENSKGQKVDGLGGGFQYCRLSQEPLFAPTGQIRPDVDFARLAAFVWFLETKTGYAGNADSPLLGIHEGRAIYLLYNGILGDKDENGGNVLTPELYAALPQHDGPKIIYAAALWGDDWIRRENIIFRQTQYELATS